LFDRPRTLDKDISYVIEYETFEGPLENIKKPQFSDEVTYHTYGVDQCKQTEDQNLEKKIKNIIIQEFRFYIKRTGWFVDLQISLLYSPEFEGFVLASFPLIRINSSSFCLKHLVCQGL
jgi:hypothetical protein